MATTQPAEKMLHSTSSRRGIAALPADSIRLDWAIAIFSCVNVFGLFIDGWAHNHGRVDNTFFTPWHALLYSAILAAGLLLVVTHFRNVNRGYRWSRALAQRLYTVFARLSYICAGWRRRSGLA